MKQHYCLMLIDDNKIDNFFHQRVINNYNPEITIIIKESGEEALNYFNNATDLLPDVIFLDINMPGMDGWEFLQHYKNLNCVTKPCIVVIMANAIAVCKEAVASLPDHINYHVCEKPINKEYLEKILSSPHTS